ncbi:solute carrier family 13 member 5-like [Gigantopelta aegis]|uniref:solute carrier family 13 member 5-like n=1 Tax=Gigantopelta aegis TaxID=1735272 RepID=UPI001B889BC1|nr:solute carrier family 13 member 5-like [Gigantopelta aegis]
MALSSHIKATWRSLVIIITPLILIPLVLPGSTSVSRCAFGLLLMAVYWMSEALPLPVTSLLPIVLFPILGVAPTKILALQYFKDVMFLLIGGLLVALAIEKSNLHRRFALKLLLLFGVRPKRLLLAFAVGTSFLSMWISNTASTAMMIPIARAVLSRLLKIQSRTKRAVYSGSEALLGTDSPPNEQNKAIEIVIEEPLQSAMSEKTTKDTIVIEGVNYDDDDEETDFSNLDPESKNLVKAVSLCVCYSANCGGIGTLTGTGPNMIAKGYADKLEGGSSAITFTSWMIFSFPVSVIGVFLVWIWVQIVFLGPRETFRCSKRKDNDAEAEKSSTEYIEREYAKMGSISFAERVVMCHFLLLIILWITRNPGFLPGYAELFNNGYISGAVPAILIAVSLFIFPVRRPNSWCFRRKGDTNIPTETPGILQWSQVSKTFPWGVVFLIGGGYALAEACQISGLSRVVALQLSFIGNLPLWLASLVVITLTCLTTEITSNSVITTIFMPILAEVAISMKVHPLYFMLPSAVSASFAFMFPVATPPNALVFAYGDVKVVDMVKTGAILNIVNIFSVTMAINTWGTAYFHLDQFPDWAQRMYIEAVESGLNGTTQIHGLVYNTSSSIL